MTKDQAKGKQPAAVERTVGIPFTTPLICGAKVRLAKGGMVELLVPNPAGARGFYVMELRGVRQYCQLTVHDELLLENLLDADSLTPVTVKRCARKVALAGAAGRDAAAAAQLAAERDDEIVSLTSYLMLMRLLRRVGIDGQELQNPAGGDKAAQSQIKRRLLALMPKIGLTPDQVLDTVGDIALYASSIGFAGEEARARHMTTAERLPRFANAVTSWAILENGEGKELADRIINCATWTHDEVMPIIIDCQSRLEDIPELVRSWRDSANDARECFSLPDWLLDGWPEIFTIWDTAMGEDRVMQRVAINQIHRLLPLSQTLAENGQVEVLKADSSFITSRSVRLHEDWKTGVLLNDIRARTEALRAGVA